MAELLRALAASKPGAVALLIGPGTVPFGPAVLDGLDMYSRLIVNLEEGAGARAVDAALVDDIRAAVHWQSPAAFLRDVVRHRFELMVIDGALLDCELAEAAMRVTPTGGILVIFGETPALPAGWPEAFFTTPLGNRCIMAVRLADNHRPRARRARRGRSHGRDMLR